MDQLLRRSLPTQQPAHGLCRDTGVLAAGDFVAHQPQGVDLLGQIPAVLTGPAPQGGDAVAQLPGPECWHRHAQHLSDILDRNSPRIPDRDITTGRHLHASLSLALAEFAAGSTSGSDTYSDNRPISPSCLPSIGRSRRVQWHVGVSARDRSPMDNTAALLPLFEVATISGPRTTLAAEGDWRTATDLTAPADVTQDGPTLRGSAAGTPTRRKSRGEHDDTGQPTKDRTSRHRHAARQPSWGARA